MDRGITSDPQKSAHAYPPECSAENPRTRTVVASRDSRVCPSLFLPLRVESAAASPTRGWPVTAQAVHSRRGASVLAAMQSPVGRAVKAMVLTA